MVKNKTNILLTECKRYAIIAFALIILSATALSGCSILQESLDEFISSKPNAETVLLTTVEVTTAIEEALKKGNPEVTFDVTLSRDEIKALTTNLSPFWGMPKEFRVLNEYSDIEIEREGIVESHDVSRVSFSLEQSINYYLYQKYIDPTFEIPSNKKEAIELSTILPTIIGEIFNENFDPNASAYDKALAVHDWLVSNLAYDTSIDMISKENGTYGALKNKMTMCQGYAEALTLILISATDVDAKVIVGQANDGSGEWIGHAWNLVFMEDSWYHIDATFNDPISNIEGQKNHYYFGQNDAFMVKDHTWEATFWPQAAASDYLFYRTSGLFAESLSDLKSMIRKQITNGNPTSIEVVASGFSVPDSELQFIYDTNEDITSIYRSLLEFDTASVLQINLEY